MSYDDDEVGSAPIFGGADEDMPLDEETLEPLPGMNFGLEEEDPDKDR